MRVTGKKTLLILCLASILLITGVGLSLAAGAPDYGQVIDDLSGLLDKVVKLSPEQAEQAVGISGQLANTLFNGGVLSDSEKTALENTLNITYATYTETRSALEGYIADYASGGKTGYAGLLNAINPDNPDTEYLMGLVLQLYNALGPETRAQLESRGITFDELVSITTKLGQIQFEPGLEITDAVRQQIAAILQEIITKSDGKLTQEDLTACGLTVENITELYGKLTPDQKIQLEGILETMGLIAGGDQEKPRVTTYQPGNDAQDVPLDAVVSATFGRDVTAVDLSGVKIEAGGSALAGTGASLEGRVLTVSHPEFQYGTNYTVIIPAGSVQAGDILNDGISWSFTTLHEELGDYKLTLDVQYDSNNNKVTVSGSLKKNDEAQTPVRDVAIGLVIEKGNTQYALAQGLTDESGAFRKTFSTASFDPGTYTVTATANLLTRQGSFTIPAQGVVSPVVETNSVTSITTSSATLNGNITNTGGENCDQRKFQYRKQGTTEWTDAGVESGSFGTGAFSFALTGLSSNTAYDAKAMAHNSAGWSEGAVVAFTTTLEGVTLPAVETGAATGITTSSATLNGNITNTGGENCDQRKFQYRKQGTTEWTDAGVESGSFGTGAFSFALTGLSSNTAYDAKAMAHNSAGWSEGAVVAFTTTRSSGGGGGGGGGSTPELTVDTYEPAKDAKDVSLDAVVKITFKQNIVEKDLTKVTIKDDQNNEVKNVKASVSGKVLTINHDNFSYDSKYTVTVPKGTVKRENYSTVENKEIVWSFSTLKETPELPACDFKDVPAGHWAADVIKELCKKGILSGYPDGTFKPDNDITRAEFTKVIVTAIGLAEEETATPSFRDVSAGDWYYGVVQAAAKAGLVRGYENGEYRPNAKITRQEIAAILVRALARENLAATGSGDKTAFLDDQLIAPWARSSIVIAVKEGLIAGYPDGTFGPAKNATRAETCAMVQRFLAKK